MHHKREHSDHHHYNNHDALLAGGLGLCFALDVERLGGTAATEHAGQPSECGSTRGNAFYRQDEEQASERE